MHPKKHISMTLLTLTVLPSKVNGFWAKAFAHKLLALGGISKKLTALISVFSRLAKRTKLG